MKLYSTGCPKCIVLKKMLDNKGIEYEVNDNVDEMINLGFTSLPVLEVDDNRMAFEEAIQYIKSI